MAHRADTNLHASSAARYLGLAAVSLTLLLAPRTGETHTGQYTIESWTTDTGLPQSSVNGIVQTRDGYLWLATFGGLVRFDGVRFQVFNPGNTPGLRASRFLRLFEDRESNLWVTTENAGLVRYRNGRFTTYSTRDGLPGDFVVEVSYDGLGNLLAATYEAEARWQGGRFVPQAWPAAEPYNRPLHRTRSGAVWHYAAGFGLHRHEGGRLTLTAPTALHVGLIFEDRRGRLWLSTEEGRLVVFSGGRFADVAVPGVPELIALKFYEDRQGVLWIGSSGHGLLRFDGREIARYTTADGLAGDDVNSLFEDREGNLWAGTSHGLSRLSARILTAYSAADGLAEDNTYVIHQDRRGDLWLGAAGGLTRCRRGGFTSLGERYGVADNLILSLMDDRAGRLWIGTWAGEVKRVEDGRVTSYVPWAAASASAVRALLEDRTGNLWIGGDRGLARWRAGVLTRWTRKNGLPGNTVYLLHEDRRGRLWLGTEAGLTCYAGGKLTTYGEPAGFAGGILRSLYEDGEGTLWAGTYDAGIYRLRDGRLTRYTTAEGLFDNGAFQILEDARGFFWVSSNRGIYRVARRELDALAAGRIQRVVATSYGRQDGMLDVECNGGGQPAGVAARDGGLWFPTQKGVVRIDPAAVPAGKPPPVAIERVIVDRRPVRFRAGVEIRPGQDNFEVHYTGLSFVKPEQVRFRYRLGGFDAGWIEADTRRTAYYTQVPPGSYRFQVLAASADGAWNRQGASVAVTVVPPFWRTWWFTALVVAVFAAAAVAGYRRRIGRLERAHAAREALSRQLVEAQEEDRRRIAAELHDSLGQELVVIRNWALVGLGAAPNSAPPAAHLKEISDRAALAIDEVREIAYNLGPYQLDRLGLTRTLEDMVERVAAPSGIAFEVAIAGLDGALPKESEINLYRVLQEAVTNAVKHSEASAASLQVTAEAGRLRVALRDDGRGFHPATEAQRTGRGQGFGLTGMAERVRLLGGTWAVRSAPGQGTAIEIHIPLQDHDDAGGRPWPRA